jgi:CRISPR-associated protein Csc1
MKVYKCELIPHDFLFFVSRDLAKIGVMEHVIHNTALNYAINHTSRIVSFSSSPNYDRDIPKFSIRVTPAVPVNRLPEIAFSYNAINDLDLSTETTGNYPTVGKYYKINLGATMYMKGKEQFLFSSFRFFAFSFDGISPRRVIRLGKKENHCIIHSEELSEIKIKQATKENPIKPSHLINPLEFDGEILYGFPMSFW